MAHLVARFNRDRLEALCPRDSGGPAARYTSVERERILAEARRRPEHGERRHCYLVLDERRGWRPHEVGRRRRRA